jgi:hypothetical protein
VPALYHLVQASKLPNQFAIIGVDHNGMVMAHPSYALYACGFCGV